MLFSNHQLQEVTQQVGILTALTFLTRAIQCSFVVGDCISGTFAGSFAFLNDGGNSNSHASFRVVVVP